MSYSFAQDSVGFSYRFSFLTANSIKKIPTSVWNSEAEEMCSKARAYLFPLEGECCEIMMLGQLGRGFISFKLECLGSLVAAQLSVSCQASGGPTTSALTLLIMGIRV